MNRTKIKMLGAVLTAAVVVSCAPSLRAQAHPEYGHALSDLRAAREYLKPGPDLGPYAQQDAAVIRAIDAAINDLKVAVADNGMTAHPMSTDSHMVARDRFNKGRDLLDAALHDLDHAEELPQARGAREHAKVHIQQARDLTDQTMKAAHWK